MLLEPTYGLVEAGCQGTLRASVAATGRRAHSARSWLGVNAIHAAGAVLDRLRAYEPRTVTIDGCTYREGMNAVRHLRRVSPATSSRTSAWSRSTSGSRRTAASEAACEHVREVFDGFAVEFVDSAPGALPGLDAAPARGVPRRGRHGTPRAKLGWTDVARFAALGVPALNFGPGDPNLAHTREEHVEIEKITHGAKVLRGLAGAVAPTARLRPASPVGTRTPSASAGAGRPTARRIAIRSRMRWLSRRRRRACSGELNMAPILTKTHAGRQLGCKSNYRHTRMRCDRSATGGYDVAGPVT